MKKTLALILSALALLIPVSAIELDVAESAEVSVAEEAVLAALPGTTHETYGDLVYFSDFDDNINWVNTAVVGENATARYMLGYDAEKAWSSNKVDDPVNSGRGKVEKLTNSSQYPYYNGIYPILEHFDLENAILTVVWDVYVPETTSGTDPKFYFQTASEFKQVTSASYDFEAGGWQTFAMPWPDSLITFSDSENINTMFGFAESGCTYYVDNFRIYAKKPIYASKPAEVDLSKGFLVFFDNGNETDAVSSDKIGIYGVRDIAAANGYYSKKVYRSTDVGMLSPGIVVKAANGTFVDNGFNGTLTLVTDVYSDSKLAYFKIADISSYGWGWGSWYAGSAVESNNTYPTLNVALNTTGTAASGFGIMRAEDSGSPYTRSVAVYYMPANHVIFADTTGSTLVDLNGLETYTLGANANGGGWTVEGTTTEYAAGAVVNVADITGKKLIPGYVYDEKPADETDDGFLVYFFNGNDSDTVKKVNIALNKNDIKESTYIDGHYLRGFDCNVMGCASHGGYIKAEDGKGFKLLEDGSELDGDFFITWNVYSITGTGFYDFVICDNCNWDATWINGIETNWQGSTPAKGEWTKITRGHHANKGVTTIGLVESGWTMPSHMGEQGYGSVAVYFRPNARVSLTDGTTKKMYDLTGETSYKFPHEYNGNFVLAWKSGESVYRAGTEVALADIAKKTFEPATAEEYYKANYAPATEIGVAMRLTSNIAKNGIRFKASLAPSKKAEADEAGFIVARRSVLEALGSELTFNLAADGVDNAEGKLFVRGVAYDKDTGKDVVYGTNEDGTEVFTGVCVGIDVTNKTQVNEVLVARPYAKLTVNGNAVIAYGAANSASLAGVASGIKAAAEAGDEAALEAYNSAKDFIEGVISVSADE